jgi:uncharacterized membrane protein
MKDLGHSLDEYINVWGRFFFLLPFALIASLVARFPSVGKGYWVTSFFAGLIQVLSTLLLSKSFKYGEISVAVAIWKIQVVLVAVFGVLFLDETISFSGVAGILVSLFGVYLLNIQRTRLSLAEPILLLFRERGMRYAFFCRPDGGANDFAFQKDSPVGGSVFFHFDELYFCVSLDLSVGDQEVIQAPERPSPIYPPFLGIGGICRGRHDLWKPWVHPLCSRLRGGGKTGGNPLNSGGGNPLF